MARPLQIEWAEDAQSLKTQYQKATDPQQRTRLHALWLVRTGQPMSAVAPLVGVHYRTLQTWISWYRHGGLAEVLQRRNGGHGGAPARLTPDQEVELVTQSKAGDIRTIWDGVEWAQQAHQVTYTYWGMRGVFQRLGLTKKVPRPKSPKASAEAQQAWKKGA